jgi:small subunit ribosomal protein S17
MKKNIGIAVKSIPKEKCDDINCPFHGTISTHGRIFSGMVTSDKMRRTVSVSWERRVKVPKFERYAKKYSKVKAHNPDCINAKIGDKVRIIETRPISKTKNFVVIEIIEKTN